MSAVQSLRNLLPEPGDHKVADSCRFFSPTERAITFEGFMQFLGKRVGPTKCYCSYCVGKNDSKACLRTLKKRGRQHAKKELEKEINRDRDDRDHNNRENQS